MDWASVGPRPSLGAHTMDGLCRLYLSRNSLIRSGDIETNPGPHTPERIVSEKEYCQLSKMIGISEYYTLGVELDIEHAMLKKILTECLLDYTNALLEVFMRWRNKQHPDTNFRAVLAEKLEASDLGGLSKKLLAGTLMKNTPQPSIPASATQTNQPLSAELVQRCADEFKFKYRNTLCKIRADVLNPDSLTEFEDIYTNLVLEEERGRVKRSLKYSDLLKMEVNGVFPRRVLVQGEAGAGKTTFCAKIAWDWVNGKHFQDFDWVIVVPLREAEKYTLGEIARSYLLKSNPVTASQLTEYMQLNQEKVFILFDGLDEFPEKLNTEQESQSTEPKSHHDQSKQACDNSTHTNSSQSSPGTHQSLQKIRRDGSSDGIDVEIVDILRSEELETTPVFVTTRPWKANDIRWNDKLRPLYTFLYVEGFNKENLAAYIEKYFADEPAKAVDLIEFVSDNDVISENMAPYPIYISMLCLMWRELDEEKKEKIKSLQTYSQIFKEMFIFLKEHYALKMVGLSSCQGESFGSCLKGINKLLEPIGSLSLYGLFNHTLVFRDNDFEHCPASREMACRVGVLSEERKMIERKDRHDVGHSSIKTSVFFPHKLFQEYLAGTHLASLYETDIEEYSRLMETVCGQIKEFIYLLYFTVSQNQIVAVDVLTRLKESNFMTWSSTMLEKEHVLVDLAFECQYKNAAITVKDMVLPDDSKLYIEDTMTAHTVAGYAFIQPDVKSLHSTRQCGPTASREIAEIICLTPSLIKAALVAEVHNNFYSTLATKGQISKVQSLEISPPSCESDSHDLAVALSAMPNLTELVLHPWIPLRVEFCSALEAMATSIKVKSLTLRVKIQGPASHHLAVALSSMPNLSDLTLAYDDPNEKFCSTLKTTALCKEECFPQISKGNFRFNGVPQTSLDEFLSAVVHLQRIRSPRILSPVASDLGDDGLPTTQADKERCSCRCRTS